MGKSFKGFSKALSLILAVAMVVTCVPTSAYAAELLTGESEDLLISNDNVAEEASDALVDASASEENSSTSIDTQKEADLATAPNENKSGKEDFEPDRSQGDITLTLASYDTDAYTLYDVSAGDTPIAYAYDSEVSNPSLDPANNNAVSVAVDSTHDFSFIMEPEATKGFPQKVITEIGYAKFSDKDDTTGAGTAVSKTVAGTDEVTSLYSTPEPFNVTGYNAGSVKVTIPSSTLTAWLRDMTAKDGSTKVASPVVKILLAQETAGTFTLSGFDCSDPSLKKTVTAAKLTQDVDTDMSINISDLIATANLNLDNVEVTFIVDKDKTSEVKYKVGAVAKAIIDTYNSNAGLLYTNHWDGTTSDNTAPSKADDNKWAAYQKNTTIYTIEIDKTALAAAQSAGKTIDVLIDVTNAKAKTKYDVTTNATTAKFYKYDTNPATSAVEANQIKSTAVAAQKAEDGSSYKIYVEPDMGAFSNRRVLDEVSYTIGGVKKVATVTAEGANNGGYFTIPASEVKGSITLAATTKEVIDVTLNNANTAAVYNTDGTVAATVSTGASSYSFTIRVASGYIVDSIKYRIGTGTEQSLTVNENNNYTITGPINNTLSLTVNTVDGSETLNVKKVGTASSDTDIARSLVTAKNGEAGGSDTVDGTGLSVTKNKPFYFTVDGANDGGTDYMFKSVTYDMGEQKGLTPQKVGDCYCIPSVTANVEITVTTAAAVTITVPTNTGVKVYIPSTSTTAIAAGGTVKVSTAEDLNFRIETNTSSTYKVTHIYYFPTATTGADQQAQCANARTATTLKEIGTAGGIGTKTILAGDLAAAKTIYVTTEETVDPASYKTVFKVNGENAFTYRNDADDADVEYPKMVQTYTEGTKKAKYSVDTLTSQALYMTLAETAKIGGASNASSIYTVKTGTGAWTTPIVDVTNGVLTLEPTLTATNNKIVKINADTDTVEPVKVGTDTIKATFKATEDTTGNTKVYSDNLEVHVTDVYTDYSLKEYSVPTKTSILADGIDAAAIAVYAKNGRTLQENPITLVASASAEKFDPVTIEYSLDPSMALTSDKDYYFGGGAGTIDADYTSGNPTTVLAKAGGKAQDIKVKAKVDFKDESHKDLELPLSIKKARSAETDKYGYVVIPTVSFGGETYFNYLYDASNAIDLGIQSTKLNSATVSYKVYELTTSGAAKVATMSGANDAAKMAAYEATLTSDKVVQDAIADGYIKEVTATFDAPTLVNYTDALIPGTAVTDATEKKVVYASVEEKSGAYEVTAVKKTGVGTVTVRFDEVIRVDGVDIVSDVPQVVFTVTDRVEKVNVDLYMEDSVGGKFVEVKPGTYNTASYGETSEIKVLAGADKGKYEGIAFTAVEKNTTITLPKANELTGIHATKTLVGWSSVTPSTTTILANYDPGEVVTITAASEFRPIYVDKFSFSGATSLKNGVLKTQNATTKADEWLTNIDNTTVLVGAEIPVRLEVKKPTKLTATGKVNTSGTWVPATDFDYETSYEREGFTIEEVKNGAGNLSGAIDNAVLASGNTIKAIASNGLTPINFKVAYTDPENNDATTNKYEFTTTNGVVVNGEVEYELKLTPAKTTVEAGTDSMIVTASLKDLKTGSALTIASNPYTLVWSIDDASKNNATITGGTGATLHQGTFIAKNVDDEVTVSCTLTDANGISANASTKIKITEAAVKLLIEDADKHALSALELPAGRAVDSAFYVKAVNNSDNTAVEGGTYAADQIDTNDKAIAAGGHSFTAGDDKYRIATITTKNAIETGTLVVTFTYNGTVYRKEIPVSTYYTVTLKGGFNANASNTANAAKFVTYKDTPVSKTVGTTTVATDAVVKVTKANVEEKELSNKTKVYSYKNISLADYKAIVKKDDAANPAYEFTGWAVAGDTDADVSYKDKVEGAASIFTSGDLVLYPTFTSALKVSGVPSTITLTNVTSTTTPMYYTVEAGITPDDTLATLNVKGENDTFFALFTGDLAYDYTNGSVHTTSATAYKPTGAGTAYTGAVVPANADTTVTNVRTDRFTVGALTGRAGTTKINLYNGAGTDVIQSITVNIDGLDNDGKTITYWEAGKKVTNDTRTVGGNTYFFGDDGAAITGSGIVEVNGQKILLFGGKVAPSGTQSYNDATYYIGEKGAVPSGWITSAGVVTTDPASGIYYADPANENKLATGYYKVGEDHYIFNKSFVKQTAPTGTTGYVAYKLSDTVTKYIDTTGKVAIATLMTVDGKQYLANEDGNLVTYAMATDGKYKLGNMTYVIDPTTNEAKPDKKMVNAKFNWTTKKPTKFQKSDPAPINTWEITYNFEGETTKQTATGSVTAVADPADYQTVVGLKKVTFTFTAADKDLAGYFSDAKGEKALTAEPAVWTYNFNNGSSTGTGEGLTVEGLNEGDEFDFTGYAIKPAFVVIDNETDAVLVEKTDYTVKWTNNNPKITALPATATVTITGKGNYDKSAITRSFKIVDPTSGEDPTSYSAVKSVKVVKEAITFDGTEKYPKNLTITLADKSTVTATWDGSSYVLSPDTANVKIIVSNNINKGTGNVTVYGSDFKKPAKATFTIAAADVSTLGDALTIEPEAAVYTKTGAKAATTVKFNGTTLVEGRDYKLNYVYNNKKDAGEKAGSVYITGKNNFKGNTKKTNLVNFDIEKIALTNDNVIVDAYEKVAPKSIKAKVYDSEGNEIAAKNYKIAKIEKDGVDVTTSKDKLKAGDEISVTVVGVAGTNVDEETEVTVNITVAAKMSSAKFNVKALTKYYNGSVVELDSTDMEKVTATVKINKVDTTLEYGTDYEIVGYKGNNKQGTMTVYVRGISDKVSGYGKFTVKLLPKKIVDADK